MDNLSRKEKLLQYKMNKANEVSKAPSRNKENIKTSENIIKRKVNEKITEKPDNLKRRKLQPIDLKKVKDAGDKRVMPGTPVALLKDRIKHALSLQSTETDLIDEKVQLEYGHVKSNDIRKIEEAEKLFKMYGIEVSRTFMEELPKELGMSNIKDLSIYWLSWIDMEKSTGNFENVHNLFKKALQSVSGIAANKALQIAYSIFQKETEESRIQGSSQSSSPMECSGEELRLVMTVEDSNEEDDDAISNKSIAKTLKFTNIDTNSTSNSNSHARNKNHQDNTVSKTTTTTTTTTGEGGRGKLRGPSDRKNQGVFEAVDVSEIRQHFENNKSTRNVSASSKEGMATSSVVPVANISKTIQTFNSASFASSTSSLSSKALRGAVALPGMTTAGTTTASRTTGAHSSHSNNNEEEEEEGGADLALLLGLGTEEENANTGTTSCTSSPPYPSNMRPTAARAARTTAASSATSRLACKVRTPVAVRIGHDDDDVSSDEDITHSEKASPLHDSDIQTSKRNTNLNSQSATTTTTTISVNKEDKSLVNKSQKSDRGDSKRQKKIAKTKVNFQDEENERDGHRSSTGSSTSGGGGRGAGSRSRRPRGTPRFAKKKVITFSVAVSPSDEYGHFYTTGDSSGSPKIRRSRRLSNTPVKDREPPLIYG